MFIAHIIKKDGKEIIQTLHDHCTQVAEYAGTYTLACIATALYFCGLVHDMGKAKLEFLDYIQSDGTSKKTVIHTFAAVIWILQHQNKIFASRDIPGEKYEKETALEILCFATGAHHGLFDLVDINGISGLMHRLHYNKETIHYEESVTNFYNEVCDESTLYNLLTQAVTELVALIRQIRTTCKTQYSNSVYENMAYNFQIGQLCRMMLSFVINSDHRDSREFAMQKKDVIAVVDWTTAIEVFEERIKKFTPNNPLNEARICISEQCYDAASRPTGIYKLDVPTGGGKTLSSLRFALHHAKQYNKKRIIYIIPFLTILKQNADDIRDYYYNPADVLEHHSDVVNEPLAVKDGENYWQTLTETWSSPLILTTTFQFLEALFAYRTSAIGRMQALCDSILIFDEIQSLPRRCTFMFNMAINFLSHYCNCTCVTCSATQPTLEMLQFPLVYAKNADLVYLTEEQAKVFIRTTIVDATCKGGFSMEEFTQFCVNRIKEACSLLVICNTKKEASGLYCNLQNEELYRTEIYHISNGMCKKHINDVLDRVRQRLAEIQAKKTDIRIILVATQIPEAGVDISFENVVRVLAGLDNAIQSDGRGNRSNEYGHGITYIVRLNRDVEKIEYIPDIAAMQTAMLNVLSNEELKKNLKSSQAIKTYYATLYNLTRNVLNYPVGKQSLFSLLAGDYSCPEVMLTQPFKQVAMEFSVFDNDTVSVIVPYKPCVSIVTELKKSLTETVDNWETWARLLKELKGCTISIMERQKEKLEQQGKLFSYADGAIYILAENAYDDEIGLILD